VLFLKESYFPQPQGVADGCLQHQHEGHEFLLFLFSFACAPLSLFDEECALGAPQWRIPVLNSIICHELEARWIL